MRNTWSTWRKSESVICKRSLKELGQFSLKEGVEWSGATDNSAQAQEGAAGAEEKCLCMSMPGGTGDTAGRRCMGLCRELLQGRAVHQCSCRAAELTACLQQVWAALAQGLPVRRDAGSPPSGLGHHLGLCLPLLCDFVLLRLLRLQWVS